MKIKLLYSLFFIFLFTYTIELTAQCHRGRINGARCCGAHNDANNNGICDYSEVAAKKDSVTTEIKKDKEESSSKNNSTLAVNNNDSKCGGCKKEKCIHQKMNLEEPETDSSEDEFKSMDSEVDTTAVSVSEIEEMSKPKEKPYSLILISLFTFGLYAFTWTLVKLKKIKLGIHRKIWNVILTLTFLVSCLFGFFLVIQINYDFVIDWYKTVLYWHVQVGIAMTIVAIFHAIWHTKYYLNMFKSKK